MPKPRYPHLRREKTRHGKIVWYVRPDEGQRKRLRAPYGSPEFEAEYLAALASLDRSEAPKPGKGTLAWLVARYQDSIAWTQLAPITRQHRAAIFKRILANNPTADYEAISRQHIMQGIDDRRDRPNAARHFLDCMKGLFKWAVDAEFVKANPCAGITVQKPRSEGFHTWTEEEVSRYEERWPLGTRQRVWFDVLLYTGLRRGDAIRLGRQHVKGGVAQLIANKNGAALDIPILPPLARSIAAGPVGDMAFIVTAEGRPFRSPAAFGNDFRAACRAAGVPGAAHGLRKCGATRAANAGATEHQLMSLFGWHNPRQAAAYTRTANRAKLAGEAARKMLRGA